MLIGQVSNGQLFAFLDGVAVTIHRDDPFGQIVSRFLHWSLSACSCRRKWVPSLNAGQHEHHQFFDNPPLVALFSIINQPCFRSSYYGQLMPTGSIFDHQMAYFSLDKNKA